MRELTRADGGEICLEVSIGGSGEILDWSRVFCVPWSLVLMVGFFFCIREVGRDTLQGRQGWMVWL